MALKRHKIDINIVGAAETSKSASNFVVDLKKPAPPEEAAALNEAQNKNMVVDQAAVKVDWLNSSNEADKKEVESEPSSLEDHKKIERLTAADLKALTAQHESLHGVKSRGRRLFYFALVLLVLILPFKILSYYKLINVGQLERRVLGSSQLALNDLMAGSQSVTQFNLNQAGVNFAAAGDNFLQVQNDLQNIDGLVLGLAALSKNEKYKLASEGKNIAAVGLDVSNLGSNLSLAINALFNPKNPDKFGTKLDKFINFGQTAVANAADLNKDVAKINLAAIPANYQDKFSLLKSKSATVAQGLAEFINLAQSLNGFLGVSQDKRYLIVFQNNNELRASGGFIGSYALLDLSEGKIKNLEVPPGGSYDTEGGLSVLVKAPPPLWLVNPLWHFWDANWWPDWRASAQNLMWFYEKSGGPTVDGVISFTPTVLEKLLTITGPIDMTSDYGVVVTADNFWDVTQSVVEKTGNPQTYSSSTALGAQLTASVKDNPTLEKKAVQNQPKKIIGDLMNRILAELPKKLNKDNAGQVLQIIDDCLSSKQILFYFSDSDLEQKMLDNSWAGALENAAGDYLAVINTNIAGGKSDRKIQEGIAQTATIQADNSIIDTVTITRAHTGVKGEPFSGVRNVDWLRVYIPAGSTLISANGFNSPDPSYFKTASSTWVDNELVAKTEGRAKIDAASGVEIYNESQKEVLAGWTMVDPGKTTAITLEYKLPFKLQKSTATESFIQKLNRLFNPQSPQLFNYSLLVQKQAGALPSTFTSHLDLGKNVSALWQSPSNLGIIEKGWNLQDQLDRDKYYAVLFKNK